MGFARLSRPRYAFANLGHPYGVVGYGEMVTWVRSFTVLLVVDRWLRGLDRLRCCWLLIDGYVG